MQKMALSRQKYRCVSCGTRGSEIGQAGRLTHLFGEGTEGDHVIPHKMGGPITGENCVVLCRACHISVHQGGRWLDASIYNDLNMLPMA
jgi:5-methylcytosine-specific restriction endonuclease McrA